jgi:uncharacterized protein (DUF427 family)
MNHPQRITPAPGQESVWDYPRPPRLEPARRHIQIFFNGELIADTERAWRVLETSHPPAYYIPPEDIRDGVLQRGEGHSFCEWKGEARYHTVQAGDRRAANAAWSYPSPTPQFAPIKDHVAFYVGPMDRCLVDGEEARPQPGSFYGGWITDDVVGPFKGEPGTRGW